MNLRQKLSFALEQRGERRVSTNSRRYVVYTRAEGDYWFLGAAGALRYGATIAGSFSASEKYKEKILTIAAKVR